MKTFKESESYCQTTFEHLGKCWHLYTSEDNEIIFTCDYDFKVGVSLFGIAALLSPKVIVLTFELMTNHLHATLSGTKEDILAFFDLLNYLLRKHFRSEGRSVSSNILTPNLREISNLDDARAVICYNNRNGFLVSPDDSPFSYPYGANSFYFNPFAKQLYEYARQPMRVKELERLAHSHDAKSVVEKLFTLNGQICPLCFCSIKTGESLFRDASHYFYCISRNIESQKRIAAEIGDKIFYTDDELYSVASSMSNKQYGSSPSLLPKELKQEFAKILRFDYNAGNKQIARILKLDISLVNAMFPPK